MKQTVLSYTRYNLWANTRICHDFLANLNDDLLDGHIVSSFPSIRKTLYHIWGAEELWLLRLQGTSLPYLPNQEFKGSFDAITKKFLSVSADFVHLVRASDNSRLKSKVSYTNTKGESFTDAMFEILLHVINHSAYHRGQVITMLRQVGFTGLTRTDYMEFVRCRGMAGD